MRDCAPFVRIVGADASRAGGASAHAVVLALALTPALAPALAAQHRGGAGEASCPFAAPSLAAKDPFEVAWAAHRLDLESAAGHSTAVANALARFAARRDEPAQLAVLHLLRAVERWGIRLPPEWLRFEPPDFARILWIAARVRSASDEGNELLQLFQSLAPSTDPAWEYVGGALALRGQRTFAVELRLALRPKLRLTVGEPRRPAMHDEQPPEPRDAPRLAGMPPVPTCHWHRTRTGGGIGIVDGPGSSPEPLDPDEVEFAMLRWLACLAHEPAPAAWAQRFVRSIRPSDCANLPQIAAAAVPRARASLAAVDAALRERFALPADLAFPPLEVRVDDHRSAVERARIPLPELR